MSKPGSDSTVRFEGPITKENRRAIIDTMTAMDSDVMTFSTERSAAAIARNPQNTFSAEALDATLTNIGQFIGARIIRAIDDYPGGGPHRLDVEVRVSTDGRPPREPGDGVIPIWMPQGNPRADN